MAGEESVIEKPVIPAGRTPLWVDLIVGLVWAAIFFLLFVAPNVLGDHISFIYADF